MSDASDLIFGAGIGPEPVEGDSTTSTAEERLAAVERFAREVDLRRFDFVEGTFTYIGGYMNGYSAARAELRALLGIEEGT